MEGIFAMYCAAHLIDPGKATDTAIEGFINDLRIDTELGDLATKGKKSIDYHRTFPGHLGTAKKHFGNGNNKLSVVTGKKARELVKNDPKYSTLQKALPVAEKFFDTVGVKGYIDFSQVELKVRVKEAETGEHYGENLEKLLAEESKFLSKSFNLLASNFSRFKSLLCPVFLKVSISLGEANIDGR